MLDDDLQTQAQIDKNEALQAIELGKALSALELNKDFQLLVQYLDNKCKVLSYNWARTDNDDLKRALQGLLIFMNELEYIKLSAEQAQENIRAIQDFETNLVRD